MVLSEKIDKNARLDRKSCMAYRSVDKKGGHGKYGWGAIEDDIKDGYEEFEQENNVQEEVPPHPK